jgi:ribosomal protein S18 acetylase RimI-like enzyme
MPDSDTAQITIASFSADSPHLEAAMRLYVAVFGGEADSVREFITRYATVYPDFHGVVALVQEQGEEQVVGMGFGTRSVPGNWWYDKVSAQVGADHPALPDAWVLVELGVLPDYRGTGLGTRLHNALVDAQPLPRLLLSTQVANTGARRLYERLGWTYLHPGFVFSEGAEPFVVMRREKEVPPSS